MKIGIVTHHRALNVGAVFQAFALQTYLQRQGHTIEFIDFREEHSKSLKDFIGKSISRTFEKYQDCYYGWFHNKDNDFWKVLNFTSTKYESIEELRANPPKCDLYISGSDQVWNIGSWGEIKPHFFLQFGDASIKKISYAASMGQAVIPDDLREELKKILLTFESISVREDKPQQLLSELLDDEKEVYKTPDPTFLLKADDYTSIIDTAPLAHNDFVLSYVLADYNHRFDFKKAFDHISSKTGKKIVNIKNPTTCLRVAGCENTVVTPYQWLNYMNQSTFTICSSFHAVVFSLLFHKPFIVLQSYENVRIQSLLQPLQLLNRCIFATEVDKIDAILDEKIDWDLIDKKMEEIGQIGKNYLKMVGC